MLKKMMIILTAAGFLTGCGKEVQVDPDQTVISIDSKKIDYATASTYVRIMQAETYGYMQDMMNAYETSSDDVWAEETNDGETYGDQFKSESLKALKIMLLSEVHCDEYDVKLTDTDIKKCKETAKKFLKNNDNETAAAMYADQDSVERLLELFTYNDRVRLKIEKEIDTAVDEKEINQSTFDYVTVFKDEDKDPKKTAEKIVEAVEDGESFEDAAGKLVVYSKSFTSAAPEYESMDKVMLEHAVSLVEGECESYCDKDGNYVVVYMKDEYDEEASDNKKETILEGRRMDLYEETTDKWLKEDIKVNNEAWESIKVDSKRIFIEKV